MDNKYYLYHYLKEAHSQIKCIPNNANIIHTGFIENSFYYISKSQKEDTTILQIINRKGEYLEIILTHTLSTTSIYCSPLLKKRNRNGDIELKLLFQSILCARNKNCQSIRLHFSSNEAFSCRMAKHLISIGGKSLYKENCIELKLPPSNTHRTKYLRLNSSEESTFPMSKKELVPFSMLLWEDTLRCAIESISDIPESYQSTIVTESTFGKNENPANKQLPLSNEAPWLGDKYKSADEIPNMPSAFDQCKSRNMAFFLVTSPEDNQYLSFCRFVSPNNPETLDIGIRYHILGKYAVLFSESEFDDQNGVTITEIYEIVFQNILLQAAGKGITEIYILRDTLSFPCQQALRSLGFEIRKYGKYASARLLYHNLLMGKGEQTPPCNKTMKQIIETSKRPPILFK